MRRRALQCHLSQQQGMRVHQCRKKNKVWQRKIETLHASCAGRASAPFQLEQPGPRRRRAQSPAAPPLHCLPARLPTRGPRPAQPASLTHKYHKITWTRAVHMRGQQLHLVSAAAEEV